MSVITESENKRKRITSQKQSHDSALDKNSSTESTNSENDCSHSSSSDASDSETKSSSKIYVRKPQKVYSRDIWENVECQKVQVVPDSIDGTCHFKLKFKDRVSWERLRDGRNWGKSGATMWSGYNKMRYYDCQGAYVCNNARCAYKGEFGEVNKVQFDSDGYCSICGSSGEKVVCHARKYVGLKGTKEVHVFHAGNHECIPKGRVEKPKEVVQDAVKQNPTIKPATIQSNSILHLLRERQQWKQPGAFA